MASGSRDRVTRLKRIRGGVPSVEELKQLRLMVAIIRANTCGICREALVPSINALKDGLDNKPTITRLPCSHHCHTYCLDLIGPDEISKQSCVLCGHAKPTVGSEPEEPSSSSSNPILEAVAEPEEPSRTSGRRPDWRTLMYLAVAIILSIWAYILDSREEPSRTSRRRRRTLMFLAVTIILHIFGLIPQRKAIRKRN